MLPFLIQAGLSKLNEATTLVDNLKQKAADQGALLAQKQAEADYALKEITVAMQVRKISFSSFCYRCKLTMNGYICVFDKKNQVFIILGVLHRSV